jgi:hypothetical protein
MSKLRRPEKAKKRLDARIKDYEAMCKRSPTGGQEYKKPGSIKKG